MSQRTGFPTADKWTARALLLVVLFAFASVASAGKVLVIQGVIQGDFVTPLKNAGHTVDAVYAVPENLNGYDQVWDVRVSAGPEEDPSSLITESQRAQYVAYLASGKRMFVVGEYSNSPQRNASVISLIQAAGGGSLEFQDAPRNDPQFSNLSDQVVQPPFNAPNAVTNVRFAGAGSVTTAGTGQFITLNVNAASPAAPPGVAVAFGPGSLANASNGGLVVVFDINFTTSEWGTENEARLLANIIGYLGPHAPDVATLQCREPATATNPNPPLGNCAFKSPMGVALYNAPGGAILYAADQEAHAVYSINLQTNERRLVAGLQVDPLDAPDVRYNGDGIAGTQALLNNPTGVAVDGSGNLYIVDNGNHAIRKLSAVNGVIPDGAVITTVAGVPTQFGVGDPALLFGPRAVTVDSAGNLFIADTMNQQIRKREADGTLSTVAGFAGLPGGNNGIVQCPPLPAACFGPIARLNKPVGVAVDSTGIVFAADEGNNRIRTVFHSELGVYQSVGQATTSDRLRRPTAVIVTQAGWVLTADYGNHVIRRVAPCDDCSPIPNEIVAGITGSPGATGGRLNSPIAIAFDDDTFTLYIADLVNKRIGVVQLSD